MSTFQELPTELLSQIINYFVGNRKQLRILATLCRSISLAVRPILLSEVSLASYDEHGPGTHRLELLNRSIIESPELIAMIRSMSVAWSGKDAGLPELNDSFLGRLTALRYLKMQNTTGADFFTNEFLRVNGLEGLEKVVINDMHLTVDEMAKFMFLKKVRCVSIECLRQRPPPTLDVGRLEQRAGESSVVDLNLGPNIIHLPEAILVRTLYGSLFSSSNFLCLAFC